MQPPNEAMANPIAEQTLARLEEAISSGQNQCLPELMEIIHALSAKATEISIGQLADLIEKHVAVMARVIAAANTFGYNPTGADISSVGEAIQVIGFERIRSLVTSLILVRHAADSADVREQRATALLAVASGLVARTLARERDIVDPELAFVSASLRQLGRLLLAAYLPDEYRNAMARAAEIGDRPAFLEQFGLSPLQLTHEVLRRSHFPARLLDTLHEHEQRHSQKPHGRRSLEAQALIGLSSFSEQLCTLALDKDRDEDQFTTALADLSLHYDNRLRFEKEQIGHTLADMGDKLAQFTGSMGFGNVAQDIVNTMRWRGGRGPLLSPPQSPPSPPTASLPQPHRHRTGQGPSSPHPALAPPPPDCRPRPPPRPPPRLPPPSSRPPRSLPHRRPRMRAPSPPPRPPHPSPSPQLRPPERPHPKPLPPPPRPPATAPRNSISAASTGATAL